MCPQISKGSFVPFVRPSVRPSAQTVYPFIRLPVYSSVTPSSLCQLDSPSTRPFLRSSIRLFFLLSRLSVRPSARPSSFLPLFCQSIRLSVRFRFSVRVCLSVRLLIPYVDPICPSGHQSVHPFVCPSFQTPMPLFFRSSVRLTIYLFTMAPDK